MWIWRIFRRPLIFTAFWLRNISINHRLLAAFLITSIIPVIFVGSYSNRHYELAINDKISTYSIQILDEISRNTSREMVQYETLSEYLIMNDSIQNGLVSYQQMSDYEKNQLRTLISIQMNEQAFRIRNLSNILILSNDGNAFFDLGNGLYEPKELGNILKATETAPGNAYWTNIRSNRGVDTIALSRKIYSNDNFNLQIGYVIILIEEHVFSDNIYKHINLGDSSMMFMTDSKGIVVSSTSPRVQQGIFLSANHVFESISKRFMDKAPLGTFEAEFGGEKYLTVSSYISKANWFLIGMIPREYMMAELSDIRNNIIITCAVTLLISGLVSMGIYMSIIIPINSLLYYAKQIRMGRLDAKIQVSYGDEMDKLTDNINVMVERLKDLIQQVEVEQQAKREAELKMLQAQINPHFLFNTLNSLKWTAMLGGNSVLTDGIESLSILLKNTILAKEEWIPLESEIENLIHYAAIQRIRYGDSFTFSYEIEDKLHDFRVLRFMLQPIVENSILHGSSEDGNQVNIRVVAKVEGNFVKISITDDGDGFDTEDLHNPSESRTRLSGIGISNVDERIRIHFGTGYGLKIRSVIGQGTETVITLPIKKEGNSHV